MADAILHPSNTAQAFDALHHIKDLGQRAVDSQPTRQQEIVNEIFDDLKHMTKAERFRVRMAANLQERLDNANDSSFWHPLTAAMHVAAARDGDIDSIQFQPGEWERKAHEVNIKGPLT